MAALKRRKGTVRTAGGPQHRGPRQGALGPSFQVTYGFARLQGRGCGQTRVSPGAGVPRLGRGSTGPAEALPLLQAQPSPTSTHCPAVPGAQLSVPPHFPPALGAVGPQAPRRSRPPGPFGRATSQPSEGTVLLVSRTTRKTGKSILRPQGRPRAGGRPQGDLHWGGCYAPLHSWWPPQPTKPSPGGVREERH